MSCGERPRPGESHCKARSASGVTPSRCFSSTTTDLRPDQAPVLNDSSANVTIIVSLFQQRRSVEHTAKMKQKVQHSNHGDFAGCTMSIALLH